MNKGFDRPVAEGALVAGLQKVYLDTSRKVHLQFLRQIRETTNAVTSTFGGKLSCNIYYDLWRTPIRLVQK